ncbi:MAG TPA: M1 family metallopeptidase [Longimicrobiaceae bacterium]|nr:M1 family metallopeptidase [Longimicrobiaceae bacterium]
MSNRRSIILAAVAVSLAMAMPGAAQVAAEPGDTGVFRPLTLPAANEYRLGSGEPGPRYWQQRADYRVAATLDTAQQSIRGSVNIRYRNNSPSTLRFVWLQVDQNLYRPGNVGSYLNSADARWGARDFPGGYDLRSVRVNGAAVQPYVHDTMMRIDLPQPLAPGQSAAFDVDYAFRIPEHGSDRMGREGQLYQIAQWFPRMAVFDDVRGWNTDPYLGQGEFYREFGDYDVSVTAPAGFVVAATGTLLNPGEVLTPAQRARLAQAARSPQQVAIITAGEAGTAATRPRGEGMLTWHWRAENVHDFAWAASPRFRWDSETVDGVQCHAFYQPDAIAAWATAADMTCVSIRDFSNRWFRYPWPQATSVAGPVGGMEYPMFVMVHAGGTEISVFATIAHEHGHEWFPMIVSSNERRYAWMDEGFNSFIDQFPNEQRYGSTAANTYSQSYFRTQYGRRVALGADQSLMLPPDRIDPAGLGVTAYRKPAMALNLLRTQVLGAETFDRAFREYVRRWAYHHPTPADFFRTMENVSGRDLSWFWRGWIYSTETLDQGIAQVAQKQSAEGGWDADITLTTNPRLVMPVPLRITLEGGQTRDLTLPIEVWYGGPRYTYHLRLPARITAVAIDPGDALPDVNKSNNVWTP